MTQAGPRLVVGLGNPGSRYAGNRHNIGFMVLDALAARRGLAFAPLGEVGLLGIRLRTDRNIFAGRHGHCAGDQSGEIAAVSTRVNRS